MAVFNVPDFQDMVREEQAQHQEARATELATLERQWLTQLQQLKREHQQRLKVNISVVGGDGR